MNVTRAVLPVMREQRSGHVVTITSVGGLRPARVRHRLRGVEVRRRRLDGVARPEVEPFGIRTTVVEPGFFRTELLTPSRPATPEPSIDDYAERDAASARSGTGMNGQQGGDPAKLAQALLTIADQEQPPFRFIAGADAIAQAEEKLAERRHQIDANRDLSSSLALDEAENHPA